MMHYYKRLLPSQLAHLREGADIIVVLRVLPKKAKEAERIVYNAITNDINSILLDSCPGVSRADYKLQLITILRRHEIKQDGGGCHEFQIRLKNWPERDQLDNLGTPTDLMEHFWKAGAGLQFDICGYS